MSDVLSELAEWASELTWEDLPAAVRKRSAQAMVDTTSSMVSGASTAAARIAIDYSAGQVGRSPLVGRDESTTPAWAAFGNAVSASALDFDDGHYLAGAIHPGSVVIPAVLAVADAETTLTEALVAQVVGYEIGLRAAHLLWPKRSDDHYHTTGCAGAIAAAAGAAKMLGLDADGIRRAVTIGWLHAPMATFGTPMVKESIGWGAHTGVAAAELAATGFMAVPPGYFIEPNEVFPPTPFHAAGADTDPFVRSFGTTYELLNTYFKFFGACRYTHAAGSGFLQMVRENQIAAADIVSVRIGTHRGAVVLDEVAPRTADTAQYSFPIVIGSLALWGRAGAAEMDESLLGHSDRLEFASKVVVEHDADLDEFYPARYPSRVEVVTRTGSHVGVFLDAPGDPGTPFGDRELRDKWVLLLLPHLGETAALTLIDSVTSPTGTLHDALATVWASSSNLRETSVPLQRSDI